MNAALKPNHSLVTVEKSELDTRIIRKNNIEIGYKIKSGSLSLLSRKLFNVLIFYAQDLRHQEDKDGRWCVQVSKLVKDAVMHSKDYDLLRASLDELQDVRVVRPRISGGVTSEVLIPSYTLDNISHHGNEELERGQKKRGGCLMLWFMLPPELKHQLLDPEQYTRLPIAYMVLLKTIPGFVLYEICRRYVTNPGHITHRDSWQNWWRVLTGSTDKVDIPEYKYAKRDVFKRGLEEINVITDIEIELIEHKIGKVVQDIQFTVRLKKQTNLDIGPAPIDPGLLAKVVGLGISISEAERYSARFNEKEIADTIALLEERMAKTHLEKVESPAAFFKKAIKESWAKSKSIAESAQLKIAEERKIKQQEKVVAKEIEKQEKDLKKQGAFEKFNALSEAEKGSLLQEFEATLAESNKIIFRKSGISSKMLNATFMTWIMEKVD